MKAKALIQIAAGALSLLLLLAYTFWHTGGLLARYIEPVGFAYAAAIGIEAAVVVLSLQIGTLKQERKDAGWLIGVLAALVIISALANIAEGYSTRYGEDLTKETIGNVDWLQSIIGIAATGLISLIVFSLAEIIGQDVNAILMAQPTSPPTVKDIASTLTDEQAKLIAFYQDNENASQSEAAAYIGKSRQWVGLQLRQLEAAGHGRAHRGGNGTSHEPISALEVVAK